MSEDVLIWYSISWLNKFNSTIDITIKHSKQDIINPFANPNNKPHILSNVPTIIKFFIRLDNFSVAVFNNIRINMLTITNKTPLTTTLNILSVMFCLPECNKNLISSDNFELFCIKVLKFSVLIQFALTFFMGKMAFMALEMYGMSK